MSQGADRQLIRDVYRRWNEEGVAGIEWAFAPGIEWIDPAELPGGGTHVGRENTIDFLREWGERWVSCV